MGADPVRIGQAGLGAWGRNLVRNVDALADLTWICDASEERRASFGRQFPNAIVTDSFAEMLADPELEAVVIATPVPTHYALAKQALEAGKHVFVEKPPAMRASEMEELVALSESPPSMRAISCTRASPSSTSMSAVVTPSLAPLCTRMW